MLKVYQNLSPRFGRGIQRVAKAIQQFAPKEIQFVDLPHMAELTIHHVIGVQNFHEHRTIDDLVKGSERQAMVQYCVASSEQPLPIWWYQHVWLHCELVWSYYDLEAALYANDVVKEDYRFYHAPLGVDPIFHGSLADRPKHPIYLVCTSGYIPETEGVLECVEAAARVGGRVLHLGSKSLDLGAHVTYAEGISDAQLAALYKSCRYVAGLRRVEGFELPAAEGLCGGAIPICFDQPHYRHWFEHAALYIPENSTEEVTDNLESLFRSPRSLDVIDVSLAQRKFSWPRVVKGFWDRILQPVQETGVVEHNTYYPPLSPGEELPHTPTEAELADLHRVPDDDIPF